MNRYTIIYERKSQRYQDEPETWQTFEASVKADSLFSALQRTCLWQETPTQRVLTAFCNAFADDYN